MVEPLSIFKHLNTHYSNHRLMDSTNIRSRRIVEMTQFGVGLISALKSDNEVRNELIQYGRIKFGVSRSTLKDYVDTVMDRISKIHTIE